VPDAPGLELIRGEIDQHHPGAVLDTSFDHERAVLVIDSAHVLAVLTWLRDTPGQGYRFLSSLHAADYLPATPRFAVHYELLNRDRVERIRVKALLEDPASPAGGVAGGTTPEEASATAGGGGSPAATGPAGRSPPCLSASTGPAGDSVGPGVSRASLSGTASSIRSNSSTIGCGPSTGGSTNLLLRLRNPIARVFA
jgi:hypothetical protein